MENPALRMFHRFLCLLAWGTIMHTARAKDLQIRFSCESSELADADGKKLTMSRCDFLLSRLALRRSDGSWMDTKDWFGLVSVGQQKQTVTVNGVPGGNFTAIRFFIGLDTETDKSDPNQWPVDHALHPQAAGLHWGWQGGYIFMALEGQTASNEGWSWHLATEAMRTEVQLPVSFHGDKTGTIDVRFDVAALAKVASLKADGLATHSRPGDTLATKLQGALGHAFRVSGTSSDQFQPAKLLAKAELPPSTAPFHLTVSKRLPKVALPADNPLTVQGVALGERLFQEKALSADSTISCVSCHQPHAAFADAGQAFSTGVGGKVGKRNSMPLFNLAWQNEFFWDGRVKGLRKQVWHPITDPLEMSSSKESVIERLKGSETYQEAFQRAFGDSGITEGRVGLALEQYLLTIISQDSHYDKAVRKEVELTDQEQRGLELFVTEHDPARGLFGADCFHCHGGNLFTNHQFMNNGLDSEMGKFRVPSLRNTALTAPYMHDGRLATLEAVVEHYNSGVKRTETLDPNLAKHPKAGLGLTPADKAALVAFLKTLTDDTFKNTNLASKNP